MAETKTTQKKEEKKESIKTTSSVEQIVIDASERRLGRLASDIAVLLMGKNRSDFKRRTHPNIRIVVENASRMDISDKRLSELKYKSYSGHPGGQRVRTGHDIVRTHGYGELIIRAVYGMLPGNKLRSRMMKNLTVNE